VSIYLLLLSSLDGQVTLVLKQTSVQRGTDYVDGWASGISVGAR
jgi:hypothetical protein